MNVICTFPLTQLCQLHWSEIPHSIVLLLRKHNWLYLALGIVCVNLFKRICKPDRFTVYCVSSRPRVKYYFWRPPVTYFERFSNHCSHSGHCTGLIWLSHFLPQDQKCMLHISRIPHLTTRGGYLLPSSFLCELPFSVNLQYMVTLMRPWQPLCTVPSASLSWSQDRPVMGVPFKQVSWIWVWHSERVPQQ